MSITTRIPNIVILESENRDGLTYEGTHWARKSPAGWAYDYGKGRVVFTAVGHTVHAMWNPQYLEFQKRSIRWLLKQILAPPPLPRDRAPRRACGANKYSSIPVAMNADVQKTRHYFKFAFGEFEMVGATGIEPVTPPV